MFKMRSMKPHKWKFILAVLGVLGLPAYSQAWWSAPIFAESTHHKVTSGAMNSILLLNEQYRDVATAYSGAIANWTSGVEDDQRAHANNSDRNDGPAARWWQYALDQYRLLKFGGSGDPLSASKPGAYYYAALIAHLTEDMGVPAHAYNIPHGSAGAMDNMEQIAHWNYSSANPTIQPRDPGKSIIRNFSDLRDFTINRTSTADWRSYYNNDGTCDYYYGEPEEPMLRGFYSGSCGATDSFHSTWLRSSTDQRVTISELLGGAGGYAGGALMAFSRSLPPLVRGLEISGDAQPEPLIDNANGTNISFTILENRMPDVRCSVTVQNPITQQTWFVNVNGIVMDNVALNLGAGNDLPYEFTVRLNGWRGQVDSGAILPDGHYSLKVEVTDHDGNEVNRTFLDQGLDINGDETPENDTLHRFEIFNPPPSKPKSLVTKTGSGTVHLSWTRPETSEDGAPLNDLKEYFVHFQQLGLVEVQSRGPIPYSGAAQQSYDLAGLNSEGKAYQIAVTARDLAGNESEYSDWVVSTPVKALWVHPDFGDFRTIPAAVNGAPKHSRIMVGPGTYYETQLTIGTHRYGDDPWDIVLQSEKGPSVTVIDGSSVSQLLVDAADGVKIIGFTFKGSTGANGAVHCEFDNGVLIANNVFIANQLAISVEGVVPLLPPLCIYNNVFDGKTLADSVGLRNYMSYGRVDVHNNIFIDNSIGIRLDDAFGYWHVEDNTFLGAGRDVVSAEDVGDDVFGVNPSCRPDFLSVVAGDPAAYHLGPTTTCGDLGNTMLYEPWLNCDGTKPDLGAFGGPYAYTDNDKNGIPDCVQPRAGAVAAFLYAQDGTTPVTLRGMDPTGGNLTYALESLPAHGTLSGAAPNLTYTVDPSYTGVDGFEYRAVRGDDVSNRAPVTVTVRETDAAPLAVSKTITVPPNCGIVPVLLEGIDTDGDDLTFTVDSAVLNGALETFHSPRCFYFPSSDFVGREDITYHATDGFLDSAPAAVTIIVNNLPTIDEFSPKGAFVVVPADSSAGFWVLASDLDASQQITYRWLIDGTLVDTSDAKAKNAYIFNPDPGAVVTSPHTVTAQVTDGLSTVEHSWSVAVKDVAVVDDASCAFSGSWASSTSGTGYLGNGFRSHTAGTGAGYATWLVPLAARGTYRVYARWPAASTYNSTAIFTISSDGGLIDEVMTDQTTNGGQWNLLGTYVFASTAEVRLQAEAGEIAVADAVRFVATDDPSDVILDDVGGVARGDWPTVGAGFRGGCRVVDTASLWPVSFAWQPASVVPGTWDVYARWVGVVGDALNAKYFVTFDGVRNSQVTVTQTVNPGRWNLLGTYAFEVGDAASISMVAYAKNWDRIGWLAAADAVKLVWRGQENSSVIDNDGDADLEENGTGETDLFEWSGTWDAGYETTSAFAGNDYREIVAGSGGWARWVLPVPAAANYEVYARWPPGADRTTAARYEISSEGDASPAVVMVNQRATGEIWHYLGRYHFDPQHEPSVVLRQSSTGVTVADALFLLRTDEDLPVIVDNTSGSGFSSSSTGWSAKTAVAGYWGSNYLQTTLPGNIATWQPLLKTEGNYDIFARWTAGADRSAQVSYNIRHDDAQSITVKQSQRSNGGAWMNLGRFYQPAGSAWTQVTAAGDGITVADAIRYDYTIMPLEEQIDNTDSAAPGIFQVLSGAWSTATASNDSGPDYRWSAANPGAAARWTPTIMVQGYYGVYAWWPTLGTAYATNAPFRIVSALAPEGEVRTVNLRTNSGKWNYLGSYRFDAGESGFVELSGEANGRVAADAVKFIALEQ
jgi:hypothetical protein